jgi:signal transduction histidine kinase
VRARDNDFNVDPTPSQCRFMVVAPVWRQGWFLMLVSTFTVLVLFLLWMLLYIREKHLLEKRAVREELLVEMDQMKTSFFTNISHELNTPLGLIRGALEHMLDHEEEREKLHDVAMRSVERMSNLVSQILDIRKLEQGRIRIEAVEGDISEFVREHVEWLQSLGKRKKITCTVEVVETCRGWFDPDKLKKIISNLVGNSIKYTQAGGEVRVVMKDVMDPACGRALSFVVEDSGAGVEPEYLQHIFERFYRIPEKSIVDGSGIGLNLTKELVDLWGGTICAESPIHQDVERPGTRFRVTLPIELEKIPNRGEGHG